MSVERRSTITPLPRLAHRSTTKHIRLQKSLIPQEYLRET
jgi:hypothetical protein